MHTLVITAWELLKVQSNCIRMFVCLFKDAGANPGFAYTAK